MVHEITFGFGGLSEKKMSVLLNFLMQNTNLVSVLSKICSNFYGLTGLRNFTNSDSYSTRKLSVSNLIKINCYNMLFFP